MRSAADARQAAFQQGVQGIQATMYTTPLGWALVAWLAHWVAPVASIGTWVGIFVPVWLANLLLLRRIVREGCDPARHERLLWLVAALDGVAWGLIVPLLMGMDRILDSWLAVVLCGVASVNAQAYITDITAFRALLAALWFTVVTTAFKALQGTGSALPLSVGITLYLGLLARGMSMISRRVTEGIRLAIENAQLAQDLQQALARSVREATTDALTGLANRRSLDAHLANCLKRIHDHHNAFAVLLLDIDHFKQINDRHGHAVGDEALRAFAQRIAKPLRMGDLCARYGGEEFVVVLERVSAEQAQNVAERIRCAVADEPLLDSPLLPASVSIGVAVCDHAMSVDRLLAAADAAVYAAKREGRNRVRLGQVAAVDPGDLSAPALPQAGP